MAALANPAYAYAQGDAATDNLGATILSLCLLRLAVSVRQRQTLCMFKANPEKYAPLFGGLCAKRHAP